MLGPAQVDDDADIEARLPGSGVCPPQWGYPWPECINDPPTPLEPSAPSTATNG
jgi:hypothetical protein